MRRLPGFLPASSGAASGAARSKWDRRSVCVVYRFSGSGCRSPSARGQPLAFGALVRTGAHVFEFLHGAAGPLDDQAAGGVALAEPEGQGQFGLRQVAGTGFDAAGLGAIGGEEAGHRADGVAIRFGPGQAQAQPPVAGQLLVAIEIRRALVGGDQKIHGAIAVEIAVGQAAGHFWGSESGAGLGGNVAKNALAAVEEQVRWLRVSHVAVDAADGLIDVSIDGHEVEAPIRVDIEKRGAETEAGRGSLADASGLRRVLVSAIAAGAVKGHHFVIEVGDGDALGAGVVEVGGVHAHAGARFAVVAEGHAGAHRDVFESAVAQVAIELVGLRVVGDEEVWPAIAVEIQQGYAQRFRRAVEDAALGRDIFERAVAAVAEEPAGLAVIGFGRAIRLALAIHAAENVVRRGPLDVVADQEVEPAVAVEIEPDGRGAEGAATAQPGLFGDVDEAAAAVIPEEAVLADGGDQEVREAIVVVVADGHTHAVHFHRQAGALGDVGEGAVTVVAVEPHGGALAAPTGPVHAVDQQNVEPAIGIVIEEGAAGAHGLGQVLGAECAAVVVELDAGGRGNVGQPEVRAGRGGGQRARRGATDRKSTRLNSSHANISYAVFC